jgi:hypothetical protein
LVEQIKGAGKEYGRRGREGDTGTKVYIKNFENSSLILNGDYNSILQRKYNVKKTLDRHLVNSTIYSYKLLERTVQSRSFDLGLSRRSSRVVREISSRSSYT